MESNWERKEEECRWGDERGGGQLEVSHSWVSCSVGGGGELSEWEGKGGMGGGEGGANLHILFLH